ncbi:hypothetical protein [Candidatus Cetobacterium colombiensis]|uniref:Uncharacterized protein n=1 Tax=Candidatus Cetobacterium colombiensis TaxID=3073100 RepID=A0ABU4W7W8_9FUSO|nr:hypothetical protein [Candidatus Cetobacterium colombiensis]MDX8335613.1 hypothetical protein [Candidatus Cetobacterium colombiensis]
MEEVILEEETKEVEELQEKEAKVEKRDPEVLELNIEDFKLIESALEIRYSSLKLDRLPIEFSTIKDMKNQNLIKTFGITDLKINELHLKDCNSRIVEINRKKYLELKNREFKLGLEIELKDDGSFNAVVNNYYYKIYKNSNLKRFMSNIKFLKEVFVGHSIELIGKLLTGRISFENRIEIMKLDLLEKEILGLESIKKEKLLQEDNSLYSLALLNLIDKTPELQSWVNFRCDLDKVQFIEGDRISIERIHIVRGNDFNIREKIVTTTPIESREIKDTEVVAYRKTCEISLEKIPRK